MINKILFTCGEVNGIGPEIIIKSLNSITRVSRNKFYVISPRNIFLDTANLIKPEFNFTFSDKFEETEQGTVSIIALKDVSQKFDGPNKASGNTAFKAIELATELANSKKVDAIITAPISKTAFNMAGIKFPGHTEMLAEFTKTKNFSMMFLSKKMKAALVSIHEPVKKIPRHITEKKLHSTFNVVVESLKNDFNLEEPKIAVLGLNPHAGENGSIGMEEEKIIVPAMRNYNYKDFLFGPFSPDAFFAKRMYDKFDVVIGMYHDQVLIPFKLLNFGGGVNFTAGLPIVRTSPDHGVAYDIAGKNLANPSSMTQAYKYAEKIVKNRKKNVRS